MIQSFFDKFISPLHTFFGASNDRITRKNEIFSDIRNLPVWILLSELFHSPFVCSFVFTFWVNWENSKNGERFGRRREQDHCELGGLINFLSAVASVNTIQSKRILQVYTAVLSSRLSIDIKFVENRKSSRKPRSLLSSGLLWNLFLHIVFARISQKPVPSYILLHTCLPEFNFY